MKTPFSNVVEDVEQMIPWRDRALTALPLGLHHDFERAFNWRPRLKSYSYTRKQSLAALEKGTKPLYWGARFEGDSGIKRVAEWTLANLPMRDPLRHYILGICFGYPHAEVDHFAETYIQVITKSYDDFERAGFHFDRSWMDDD